MVGEGDGWALVGCLEQDFAHFLDISNSIYLTNVIHGGIITLLSDSLFLGLVYTTRSSRIASISSLRHGTPRTSAPDPSLLLTTI